MSRQSDFEDLTGLNLYNANGGVVQGQICGQGLMTKLLRNNKQNSRRGGGMSLVENPLLYSKEPSLCMSPVPGKSRKTRYRSNMYENMSHGDTESCSSSEGLFSEASSNAALNQTIEEFQQPSFVAQFDPGALPPVNNSNSQQQGGTPRKGVAWASSLPAVLEEQDSQSAQGSEQGSGVIWRGSPPPSMLDGNENRDESLRSSGASPDSRNQWPAFQNHSHDTTKNLSLHDSDRVGVLPSLATEQQQQQQQQDQSPILKGRNKREQKKLSKQQQIRAAMERRIQQAMDAQMREGEQEQESYTRDQQHFDMFQNANAHLGVSYDGSTTSSITTNNHQNNNSTSSTTSFPKLDLFENVKAENFLNEGPDTSPLQSPQASPKVDDVTRTMQDLLLQQQMSLKEMSLQNYNYRKELAECQEMFGKWKTEREEQQTTIETLVQEKETYAKEAHYLRGEMAAIRAELESLRQETQLHAEYKEYHDTHGTAKEKESLEQEHTEEPQQEAQPQTRSRAKKTSVSTPPKKSVTISTPEKASGSSSKPESKAVEYSNSRPDKPLASGLRKPLKESSTGEPKRTVKFHDPPLNKEWTLFPASRLHEDNPVSISAAGNSTSSNRRSSIRKGGDTYGGSIKRAAEARQQEQSEREDRGDTTFDSTGETRVQEETYEIQKKAEVAAVYKYRLEAIQKNRQQRGGRKNSGGGSSSTRKKS